MSDAVLTDEELLAALESGPAALAVDKAA